MRSQQRTQHNNATHSLYNDGSCLEQARPRHAVITVSPALLLFLLCVCCHPLCE